MAAPMMAAAVVALLAATTLHAQTAATTPAITRVGRYRLQSNPWVNLHQRLVHQARFQSPGPTALAGNDLARWTKAVDAYREFLGTRNPIFDEELVALNTALSANTGWALPPRLPKAAADALGSAMPIYRSVQWEEDDRINRFWIAVAAPMLESAAEELAEAHAKAYGVPFPTRILVDVAAAAWQFGAYTVGEGESAHAVISSRDRGSQGFAALELLLHEPSHAIVAPASGAIGADLARVAKELGVRTPRDLWHALLFYTTGELTRRALERRGVPGYQPFILDMYERAYRGMKEPLETHWQAYLDGKVTREEAIRRMLSETTGKGASEEKR